MSADVVTHRWTASDGVELTYYEVGSGRSVILLHGLFSDAHMNWIKFGHAARIAAAGFRVIMPDHRALGASGKPHDPAAYGPGVLAQRARPQERLRLGPAVGSRRDDGGRAGSHRVARRRPVPLPLVVD